ncbi:MAG: hypothetical protein J5779_01135 [Clostridia bacterium]|nr:hypothetical protein [Clostridia bacterium]
MKKFKLLTAVILVFCLCFAFVPAIKTVYADTLSVETILSSEYQSHELALPFSTSFEGANDNERLSGWEAISDVETSSFSSEDMTSDIAVGTYDFTYSQVGAASGERALMIFNELSASFGVENDNTHLISLPAKAIRLLTLKVKVQNIESSNGVYITLYDAENIDNYFQIKKISSTKENEEIVYKNYSFLIYGNELKNLNLKISISLGDDFTSTNEEGVVFVDDIRMFALSSQEASNLQTADVTVANFKINSNVSLKIKNGLFNESVNQPYNISELKLFNPANFSQTTSLNNEEAIFGTINTNQAVFAEKFPLLLNPGLTTYQEGQNIATANNNVLMLNNQITTHQKIVSDVFTASKDSIYELSFDFCTPAEKEDFASETNSLSFYVYCNEEIIYSNENVFSYDENEHSINLAQWKRLSLVIETANEDKTLTFVVEFGSEQNTKQGAAYLDNLLMQSRTASTAFNNIYANTLKLNDEENFLTKGSISLDNLRKLQENNIVKLYSFSKVEEETATAEETKQNQTGVNLDYLWFVIPSVLLAVCTIAGLLIFYGAKIKTKLAKTKKQKSKIFVYNRNSTTKAKTNTSKISNLEQLEKDYKSGKIDVDEYLKKREKLEKE